MNTRLVPRDVAPFMPPKGAPEGFVNNIRESGESASILVNGDKIHCLSWNLRKDDLPTLVFVHGFGGHAHWWSFLMPFFAERYRLLVIDLPGMGDAILLDGI